MGIEGSGTFGGDNERLRDAHGLEVRLRELERKVSAMDQPDEIGIVRLDINNTNLVYRQDSFHVLLILDATNGSFSVALPSVLEARRVIFIVKKVDETANTVTFNAKAGEYIHDTGAKAASLVISTTAPMNMVSDRVNSWLVAG
jgi:hypothetical protein